MSGTTGDGLHSSNENRLRYLPDENRYEMDFEDGKVWADYAKDGEVLSILHVEAEAPLRGTGASGVFMEALANHARDKALKLRPICGYAAVWLKRHHDHHDVLAA